MGHHYYKEAANLDPEDGIDDVSYVPEDQTIIENDRTLYRVSCYQIRTIIFKSRGASHTIHGDDTIGDPGDFDILELSEITIDPGASIITKEMESTILYVQLTTVMPNRIPKKDYYEGIFTDENIFNRELELFAKKNKSHGETIFRHDIINSPLRETIAVGKKKLFITREIDQAFISILLDETTSECVVCSNLQLNRFDNDDHIRYNYNDFKKRIPESAKIIKIYNNMINES